MKTSRVYCYGLLSPTLNTDLLDTQIKLAHTYRNKLVEIELAYRTAYDALMECEELRAVDLEIANAPSDQRKPLYKKRKKLRLEWRTRPEIKKAIDQAVAAKFTAIRENRHLVSADLYWGTYLCTENAADAAAGGFEKPKYKRWKGEGVVAVQLQKGLAVQKLLAAHDTRAKLNLALIPVPGRGGKPLPRISIRIGSDEHKKPIWAEWPLVYHRELPPDGVVKWIKVLRDKSASRNVWSLHITVDTQIEEVSVGARVLALDLRWKADDFGGEKTQRAGEWTNGEEHGVFMLDPVVLGGLAKADSLRSIRDRHQNEMMPKIIDWAKTSGLPAEHKERLERIALWKSPARFASLAVWWRNHRIEGDQKAFDLIEAWRKRDKHLWLYETGTRERALRYRNNQYRICAARLSEKHSALVIENLNLDELAVVPVDDDAGQQKARKQRVSTAPSELRMAFVNAFRKQGKTVYTVKPGPLRTVWQAWCEKQGVEKKASPARSKRFNRLRKIVTPQEGEQAPTA